MRATDRYRNEVHYKKVELKRATEQLVDCHKSLIVVEKDKDYAGRERDWVLIDLEQAKAFIQ